MVWRVRVLLLGAKGQDTPARTLENIVSKGTCFARCAIAIRKGYAELGVDIVIHGWEKVCIER